MAMINKPQQQGDALGKVMSIASTVGGFMSGNPLAVAGGLNSLKNQTQAQAPQPMDDAVSRRLAKTTIPLEEKVAAFHAAERYLPELPEDVRYEVSPAVFQMGIAIANEVKSQNQGVA